MALVVLTISFFCMCFYSRHWNCIIASCSFPFSSTCLIISMVMDSYSPMNYIYKQLLQCCQFTFDLCITLCICLHNLQASLYRKLKSWMCWLWPWVQRPAVGHSYDRKGPKIFMKIPWVMWSSGIHPTSVNTQLRY